MTMRVLLILTAIVGFSASAFAHIAAPKGGDKPLKQAKPSAPLGCKLVGTVKGTKLWAGDCAAASELRGTTPAAEPATLHQHPKQIPPLANNRHSVTALGKSRFARALWLRNTADNRKDKNGLGTFPSDVNL